MMLKAARTSSSEAGKPSLDFVFFVLGPGLGWAWVEFPYTRSLALVQAVVAEHAIREVSKVPPRHVSLYRLSKDIMSSLQRSYSGRHMYV